jgi:hypothetical protein
MEQKCNNITLKKRMLGESRQDKSLRRKEKRGKKK